jgi:hypothetical protein
MNDLSYHSIQDGVDSENEHDFNVEENLEVSLLHVAFSLRGLFARQGKSFEACILTPREWYRCSSFDPLVISQPRLQEFFKKCLQ